MLLQLNKTWDIILYPHIKPIGCKWIDLVKLKPCWVSIKPILWLWWETRIRDWIVKPFLGLWRWLLFALFSLVASHSWSLFQMDVKSTFFHGDLKEVYAFASSILTWTYGLWSGLVRANTSRVRIFARQKKERKRPHVASCLRALAQGKEALCHVLGGRALSPGSVPPQGGC